jgi:DNA-binding Lrp family transcriptional regulator
MRPHALARLARPASPQRCDFVDARDVELLRILAEDPRAPAQRAARKLGLSANAVKARLAKLRAEGALQGFVATPRAAALGLREALLVFEGVHDAAEREEELLRVLPEVPGVRFADVGPDAVHLHLLARDEADFERIERAAISLCGKPPAHRALAPAAPAAPLDPADARLAAALLADARRPLPEIAKAAALSTKTARRRLEAMLARGDLRMDAVLSPAEAGGLALCGVTLEAEGPRLDHAVVAGETPREAHARARTLAGAARAFPLVGARRAGEAWLRDAILSPQPGQKAYPPAAPTVRR